MAGTTQETNTDLVARAYAAFSAGDLRALSELISADVVWIVGGNNRLTGMYHGRAATFDYFGQLLEATGGTLTITVLTITEIIPDTVIVTCHVTAEVGDRTFDEELVQQLHLRHGQAIACRTFHENGYLWDELIGPKQIALPTASTRESLVAH